jgi:tetratricopeptide (TPR) repeat protein
MSKTTAPIAALLSAALCLPTTAVAFAAPPPTPPGGVQPGGADPTAGMSEEQKLQRAKQLYGEADTAFQGGNFAEALTKFEEAYNVYAPNFHVFNFNIGLSAYEVGDCVKAKTAFQRFLDLVADHPSRGEAQQKLIEIERSGCAAAPQPSVVDTPTTAPVTEDEEDSPLLTSKQSEREEAIERERAERNAKKQHPLVITGAVFTAVGVAALIGSGVSLAIANSKANKLADLASPGPTGFPAGNYSDEEVFALDRQGATSLPANNAITIALLVGGAVFTGVGIGLLVVGVKKKKAERGGGSPKNAEAAQNRSLTLTPAYLPGGGGASARVRF